MGRKFDSEHVARLLAEARAARAVSVQDTLDAEEVAQLLEEMPASRVPFCYGPEYFHEAQHAEQIQEQLAEMLGTKKVMGVARDDITYNDKQQEFITRALAGEHLVLIGAAGTGKTTCQRGFGKALIREGKIRPLTRGTKWLKAGVPGIAVVSFTNKAVNNIRHALPDDIKPHALTIHKLLEYAPVWYEVDDPANPGKI
jgi:ABC-type glutathione transport system ATPase component